MRPSLKMKLDLKNSVILHSLVSAGLVLCVGILVPLIGPGVGEMTRGQAYGKAAPFLIAGTALLIGAFGLSRRMSWAGYWLLILNAYLLLLTSLGLWWFGSTVLGLVLFVFTLAGFLLNSCALWQQQKPAPAFRPNAPIVIKRTK